MMRALHWLVSGSRECVSTLWLEHLRPVAPDKEARPLPRGFSSMREQGASASAGGSAARQPRIGSSSGSSPRLEM